MFRLYSLVIVLFFIAEPFLFSSECQRWFKELKLKSGEDCLVKCAASSVNMSTFHCPGMCDDLCKSPQKEKWLFQLSDLYPGLTDEERALVAKVPSKMLSAYNLTWIAEKLCLRIYPSSQTNNESDACRHFVWAALLYKEFGIELSSNILNAHEQDPKQPQIEKSMDLANNRLAGC